MNINATITSIGSYLPAKKITNFDLEKTVDTTDEWIISRTGIKERRQIDKNQSCSDIALEASKRAIDNSDLDPGDIDLIIHTSLSPDKPCPSTASILQGKLGLKNAAAFDLSAACAGFSFAVTTASSFIKSGAYKNILVVGSEAISRLIDYSDRNTCILFGDGAGAVIIQETEEPNGIIQSYLATDGTKADLIEIPAGGSNVPASNETIENKEHFLKMKGKEVFKFAVKAIPDAIKSIAAKANIEIDDIDLIIPHQANLRIINAAARQLSLDNDKFYTNLQYFGNTSTASIPLALEQAIKENRIKKGDLIVIIGFGGGLSWGANLIRWGY